MTDFYFPAADMSRSPPSITDRWLAEALTHFHAGRFTNADKLCGQILQAHPGHGEALNLWAAIMLQQGQPGLAVDLLARAIEANPAIRAYHHNQANILRQLGRGDAALRGYRQALTIDPQAVDSCYELALCHIDAGDDRAAAACFKAVLISVPQVGEAYHQLGIRALVAGAQRQALGYFSRAVQCQPDFTDAITNLAILLQQEGRTRDAHHAFRLAGVLRPEDPFIINNLGSFLKESDETEELMRLLERAVILAPGNAEFQYGLAMSRPFNPGDGRLRALEKMAERASALDAPDRMHLHFALAKAHDDLGDRALSFDHQLRGNALKRGMVAYDEAKVLHNFARIQTVFSAERARLPEGEPSDLPIFILGMPRSGSTLIEQILASHKDVFGAGELSDLPSLVSALGDEPGPFFPEIIPEMNASSLRALGARYVAGLAARAPEARRITDKMPSNFQLIGLIHEILPNARIIHTRRDAVDSCLSIFSKLFSENVPYAYDLAELGRYWHAYDRLMQHWQAVLPPGTILTVDYEQMVADQETQTRRLLDFCGLDWDEACLQFHRTRRVVKTASKLQVRKPIYASSVGRWRPDASLLAPLLAGLGGAIPPR